MHAAPGDPAVAEITIPAGEVVLDGILTIPSSPLGVVAFAHGSGSSRHSPRNRQVAERLVAGGLATLLIDLLTHHEEQRDLRTRELRFDIRLLGDRLIFAVDWLEQEPSTAGLAVGCFGASTGAAAALIAAAARPLRVGAVVSRGGRPDLAEDVLPSVIAPTLLIVGGADSGVEGLNRQALRSLRCPARLEIVAGATHLFEEPGALETVSELACEWFVANLTIADAGG